MQPDVHHRWAYLQQGGEVGLRYWADTVNQQSLLANDGQAIHIDLDVRNWGSFREACTSSGLQVFERMLLGLEDDGQPMANPYDFIFLPGYYNHEKAALTQLQTARDLAAVAFSHMQGVPLPGDMEGRPPVYTLPSATEVPPILAWSPDLLVSDSITSTYCGPSTVPDSVLAPFEEVVRTEGCINRQACDKFANVSGSASREATDLAHDLAILDINMPFDTWALDGIDRILAEGGADQTWAFLLAYPEEAFHDPAPANCDSYKAYVSGQQQASATAYSVNFTGDIIDGAETLKALNPDVVFHCGDELFLLFAAASFIAVDWHPQAFLTDRPTSSTVYKYLQAFNTNYLIDVLPVAPPEHSRPCPVFGTYKGLWDGFQTYAMTHYPDWVAHTKGGSALPDLSAMQAALTGAMLTAALMEARTTRESDVVTHLKQTGVDTFGGFVRFDASGRRLPIPTTTRQLRPVDRYPDHPEKRMYKSDSLVVSSKVRDACQLERSECNRLYLPGLMYPALKPRERLLEIYPCDEGCYMTSPRFPACQSCPVGTSRDNTQLDCAPCIEGYYAEFGGRSRCTSCVAGADCSNASAAPRARAGFFQTAGQECAKNVTARVDALRGSALHPSTCAKPSVICEYVFAACRPIALCLQGGVCVGSNTGFLCGSCEAGSAVHGFRPGRRECSMCPSSTAVIGSFASLAIFWLLLVGIVVRVADHSTHSSDMPGICALRCFWHYIIMLQVVLEVSRLDSLPLISTVIAPATLLYRPFDVVYFKCWAAMQGWDEEDMLLFTMVVYRFLVPVGAAAWFSLFLMYVAWQENREVIHLVRLACVKFRLKRHLAELHCDDERVGLSDVEAHSAREQEEMRALSQIDYETILRHVTIVKRHVYIRQLGTIVHCIMVWVTFCHPIAVRGIMMSQSCVTVKDSTHGFAHRLTLNYGVQCSSEFSSRLKAESMFSLHFYAFGLPIVLFLASHAVGAHTFLFDASVRHATAFLTEGYRPPAYFWEFIVMLRTSVLLRAMTMESAIERHAYLLLVLAVWLIAGTTYHPIYWRFLQDATSFATTACLVMVVAGALYAVEEDDPLHTAFESISSAKDSVLTFALLVNAAALLNGVAWTFFKTQSVSLEILMESGNYFSTAMFNFHSFARFFGGLHRVFFFKDAQGQYTIDAAQLNQRERADLLNMLTEMVRACIDSGPFYHAYLMENAVCETFRRALEARMQCVRDTYSTYGQHDRMLLGCAWFKVMMRQPDIPLIAKELPSRPSAVLGSFAHRMGFVWRAATKNRAPSNSIALTIEELRTAARSVMVDVLEHQPVLHQAPPAEARKRRDGNVAHHSHVCLWGAEPCDTIMEDMAGRGILMEVGTAPPVGKGKDASFALHPAHADFLGLQSLSAAEQEARCKPKLEVGDTHHEALLLVMQKQTQSCIAALEEEIFSVKQEIRTFHGSSLHALEEDATRRPLGSRRRRPSVKRSRRQRQQWREQCEAEACELVDRIEFALKSMEQAAKSKRFLT